MGTIFGFNWRKSDAHLLLLSRFLAPRTVSDFSKSDAWQHVLGEAPSKAIERFLHEGIIRDAPLAAKLDYTYKVSDLKRMANEKGLATSGRKAELIERLLQSTQKEMQNLVHSLPILICTDQGRVIAEKYLDDEKSKRNQAEEETLNWLRQREFQKAASAVASFRSQKLFPHGIGILVPDGMGIDWNMQNQDHDIAILTTMFTTKPKVAAQLDDRVLEQLRMAAGMNYLWGRSYVWHRSKAQTWLPHDILANPELNIDKLINNIILHAHHQVTVADYRSNGVIKKVEIMTANDDYVCEACKKLARKTYNIDRVPDLPYEKCTCESGCRCFIVGVV